jgi:hypothetical protein
MLSRKWSQSMMKMRREIRIISLMASRHDRQLSLHMKNTAGGPNDTALVMLLIMKIW